MHNVSVFLPASPGTKCLTIAQEWLVIVENKVAHFYDPRRISITWKLCRVCRLWMCSAVALLLAMNTKAEVDWNSVMYRLSYIDCVNYEGTQFPMFYW